MSDHADRSRVLRSKKAELSGIVTSRKRKLREFFAVCDNENPIPQIDLKNIDAPPSTPAERHFLEVSDILQNRFFDESNLPPRRQLRSNTAKQRSPIRKATPESRATDGSRKAASKVEGLRSRRSRATTPGSRDDEGLSKVRAGESPDASTGQGVAMQRSSSKGSQTDLPTNASMTLGETTEQVFEQATQDRPSTSEDGVASSDLERNRIRKKVESPPNSPGADPSKVLPNSVDDISAIPGLIVGGNGSHDGSHKAATVHLPPREVQEAHLRMNKKSREKREGHNGHLSINLPPREPGRTADPLSSPGSTAGANSATTPALHEASTDTSPDNDGNRYDAEGSEHKPDDAQTPPELRPSPEEVARKEEHDRIQRAQIEISRREILGSSPYGSGGALNLDEEDATPEDDSARDHPNDVNHQQDSDGDDIQQTEDQLTREADEIVQDTIMEQDELESRPSSKNGRTLVADNPEVATGDSEGQVSEIATSDTKKDVPRSGDAMDLDVTTVKDSFESTAATEVTNASSPVANPSESLEKSLSDSKMSSAISPTSTPRRTPSIPITATQPLERMTTRVSSGAMRHKSVSEILGEIPRPNTSSSSEKSPAKGAESDIAGKAGSESRSATPQSPSSRVRSLVEKAKEKERSKLSAVIFSGPGRAPTKSTSNDTALMPNGSKSASAAENDYFTPLFVNAASTEKRGPPPLENLVATAHKTITTSNAYVPIIQNQTVKVLKRIYQLQSADKWSLRQPKRSVEPIRPTTHWDVLLQEAKWMRTDFREERKWKAAVARNLAFACAEWMLASVEDRRLLQVRARIPQPTTVEATEDTEMGDSFSNNIINNKTPELDASADSDSQMEDFDEELRLDLLETVSPTAIFALSDDDVVFGLKRSPTSDRLLNELPMYGAPLTVPQSELPTSELDPDRLWKRPALPLSKFVEGRMEVRVETPPRKRSRFEYEDDEDEDDDDHVVFVGDQSGRRPILPPEKTDVALFNPEHKHIRDRIHSSHQFRPPSEFNMPLQSFFECRTASQWTWDEDNELKSLVRDFSYNWSLISSMLTSKSLFPSGAERRTPWECFERWIHMEGLPADMQKTHYFRAYTSRIEQANRNVMERAAQVPQQPSVNGQLQPPPRRRTTISVRVERRRNQKHLTLVDAMRKLAKKRETSIQKQQHAAGLAAMRKANEAPPARNVQHTPQDFSRLKHEREEQMKERIIQLQQRQEAQRRAMNLQQRNAQNPQQAGQVNPNLGLPHQQQSRMPPANGSLPLNGVPGASGQNLTVPGQNRPRPMPPQVPGASMQNGLCVPQMPMNGVPSVQMHGIQGQLPQPNPALDVNLVARAQNISEQQRQAIRMQQQQGQLQGQSPQMHNSPPRMNGMPQPGFPMPPNMMPPYNSNTNGVGTPPTSNMIASPGQGQSGSPLLNQAHNSAGVSHVKVLEQQLQAKYPNATPEQVKRMIQEHLSKSVHQHQQRQGLAQSAMSAAAGAAGVNHMTGMNPGQGTPQLYAQMLRQQQESQQKAAQAQAHAANTVGNSQGPNQGNSQVNGNLNGHAHRASSGSVQSGT